MIEAGYTNIYVMGNKASQRSMAAAAGVPLENIFRTGIFVQGTG